MFSEYGMTFFWHFKLYWKFWNKITEQIYYCRYCQNYSTYSSQYIGKTKKMIGPEVHPNLLKDKLNKVRKYKLVQFSKPHDALYPNLAKIRWLKEVPKLHKD